METSYGRSSNPIAQLEDNDEEINLCLRIIKSVDLKINKSETVGRLKTLLCEKEGIHDCLQQLFFEGNHLENDNRLVDYGIHGNSTLNAYVENSVPLRLSIKIPSVNRTITVEARTQDMIQNVKAFIEAKEKIGSDQYNLFYAGKMLEEDKTLAFLEIIEGSTLHMVYNPRDTLEVSVKTLTGEIVKTQMRMLYTILDVKTVLESKVGYPVKVLAYGGKELEDSETLSCYNIHDDSVLEMLPPATQIFIKWCGKSRAFEVYLWGTVKSLKEEIFVKLGVPVHVQKLVFEGKTLDDYQELGSYRVQKDSNIQLSFQQSSSNFLQLLFPTV